MKFPLSVKAIIRNGEKILVLKRSATDDHKPYVWETPGGGIDRMESPQEAIVREVREETGLTIIVLEPFNIFTFTKDNGEFKVGITFLCDYISGEVALSQEHEEYRWIFPHEFKDLESVPSLHVEIAKYAQKSI